uniref:Uncharacterized protein n=1 Tax=Cucumis melo TaxID=3656 RepID=A0A9I9CU45_CUCME
MLVLQAKMKMVTLKLPLLSKLFFMPRLHWPTRYAP